ncbi:hypothetical protein K7432_004431 [Basidiobolus ranarum]|uniref:Uncharacterized protein n=1 Tax=Basidiobolus ranarum TaxID=34480 RepID=A0ABR2W4N0_9FUNG
MRRAFKIALALAIILATSIYLTIPERGDSLGHSLDVSLQQKKIEALPEEKFLVYLPQDTFYHQKIGLENGILLAYYLNRTLIVPPVYLGNSIEWAPFDSLYSQVTSKSKQLKKYCSDIVLSKLPSECLSYTSWTKLPWSYFFDFSKITDYVRIYEEQDISIENLGRYGISVDDISVLEEDMKYHYKFSDASIPTDALKGHFKSLFHVSKFQDQKLLYIHSLNGRGRVQASHPNNSMVFQEMLKSYVWKNQAILDVANTIIDMLGGVGNYIGVEIPTLGLEFSDRTPENVREILATLAEKTPECQNSTRSSIHKCLPRTPEDICGSPIIYLSTDSINPRSHTDLTPLFQQYPCTFTLQDFHKAFSSLSNQVNNDDQVNLAPFLASMTETEIVSRGSFVANIRNSMQGSYAALLHDIYFHQRSKIYTKMDFSNP